MSFPCSGSYSTVWFPGATRGSGGRAGHPRACASHSEAVLGARDGWALTRSRGRMQWGSEAPGHRLSRGARGLTEVSIPTSRRFAFLSSRLSGVFCPISLFWTQVVTTVTRLPSSLIRSSSCPIGGPSCIPAVHNSLNNLWRSLQKENKDLYQKFNWS